MDTLAILGNKTRVGTGQTEINRILACLTIKCTCHTAFVAVIVFASITFNRRDNIGLADIVTRFPEAIRTHTNSEFDIANKVERADHTFITNQERVALTSNFTSLGTRVPRATDTFTSSIKRVLVDGTGVAISLSINKLVF